MRRNEGDELSEEGKGGVWGSRLRRREGESDRIVDEEGGVVC